MNRLLLAATLALVGAVPSLGQEDEQADALAAEIAETAEPLRPAKPEPRLSPFAWVAYGGRSDLWGNSRDLGIGGGVSVRLGPARSRFRALGAITFSIPNKPAPYTYPTEFEMGYVSILYNDASGRRREAKSLTWTYEHYNRVRGTLDGICILNRDAWLRVHVGAGVAVSRSFVRGAMRAIRPDGTSDFVPLSGRFHVASGLLLGIEMGHGRLKPFVQSSVQGDEGALRGGVRF